MSQSLLAFDTDHIKSYVFGTSKLKEIRGASSLLDYLNRVETKRIAEKDFKAITIYAHGGSALFVVDSDKAEQLGKAVKKLYHERTGGGASITYAIQPIPAHNEPNIMDADPLTKNVTMKDVLKMLRVRLRLAKDSLQMSTAQASDNNVYIARPSHALLCTCDSCGVAYAENLGNDNDPDEPEGRYCRICLGKRKEDNGVKTRIETGAVLSRKDTLWGHILDVLSKKDSSGTSPYDFSAMTGRPKDFDAFREFTRGKDYLGLIYADANGMGKAIEEQETLRAVKTFAENVDKAVFDAMGDAIRKHLPVQGSKTFPFDILLVGGDDIVIVTPADKAMQVAYTLADRFHYHTQERYTLSVGVVLAPVKYPFNLQRELVDETIKAAKKSGSLSNNDGSSQREQSRINFIVVTGNTSQNYTKVYEGMHRKKTGADSKEEFYATMRPYTLAQLEWLLGRLQEGSEERLGRTKLHQLREAILKRNRTTTTLEALALFRNWDKHDREFIKQMVQHFDTRTVREQQQMGPIFPWYLDTTGRSKNDKKGEEYLRDTLYRTPLLDFIELYDFVSS